MAAVTYLASPGFCAARPAGGGDGGAGVQRERAGRQRGATGTRAQAPQRMRAWAVGADRHEQRRAQAHVGARHNPQHHGLAKGHGRLGSAGVGDLCRRGDARALWWAGEAAAVAAAAGWACLLEKLITQAGMLCQNSRPGGRGPRGTGSGIRKQLPRAPALAPAASHRSIDLCGRQHALHLHRARQHHGLGHNHRLRGERVLRAVAALGRQVLRRRRRGGGRHAQATTAQRARRCGRGTGRAVQGQ